MNWYVLKSPSISLDVRTALKDAGIQFFLPTHEVLCTVGRKKYLVERPLVLNFLFVYEDLEAVKAFLRRELRFRLALVYRHKENDEVCAMPLIVPDDEMRMFARAVGCYKDAAIPFVLPQRVDLQEGDFVRIIGGPFEGVEGVLITQKGKSGGRVMVSVSNLLSMPTLHIEPQYLQILQYGKSNKHFYQHLDSFVPRLERALTGVDEHEALCVFTRRYGALKVSSLNAEVKLTVLLSVSCRLLGDHEKALQYQEKLQGLMPKVKSKSTLSFVQRFI